VGGGGPLNIPWYYANVTVPAGTAEGTYTVVAARMTDDAGGTHSYAGSELGPQTSFQVIDGAGAPPVLHSFQMSPLHVDTSAAPGLVHYWAHLTDVSGVTSTFPTLTGPGGGTFPGWGLDQGLTSGTAHDGIWEGDFYLPKRAAPGHYRLGGLTAYDLAANEATFGPAEVAALGGPVDVFQDGDGDATPPEVLDFTFAPAPDHPNFFGGTPYAWSAHVQDSDSGVTNSFYSGSVYPVIRDASGQVPLVIQEGPLVSGTDNDATWSGHMTVPDSATPGTYSIELNATDNARNARTLTPGQLQTQGWPSSFDFP
jgi:hypothetical protein